MKKDLTESFIWVACMAFVFAFISYFEKGLASPMIDRCFFIGIYFGVLALYFKK